MLWTPPTYFTGEAGIGEDGDEAETKVEARAGNWSEYDFFLVEVQYTVEVAGAGAGAGAGEGGP